MLYAIKHKKTGKYITGTNFRTCPPSQIMNENLAPLILNDSGINFQTELLFRNINFKYYKAVPIEIHEIKGMEDQCI